MKITKLFAAGLACPLALAAATSSSAATYQVAATSDLYRAGGVVPGDGGTDPVAVALNGATSLTFSATGSIILNNGTGSNSNTPDGVGSASGINVSSFNNISGVSAYQAGFLAGVFLGTAQASAPGSLSYTTAASESASTYSPLLQQTFFIGDGLTGAGTGSSQVFFVPSGATTLYLGIADASGYSGAPSAYVDNSGAFAVAITGLGSGAAVSGAPEPGAWVLMLGGVGAMGVMLRRRRAALIA